MKKDKYLIFKGKNKRDSIHKAIQFFYNSGSTLTLEEFAAKCRLQADLITVHYYPDL